MCNKLHLAIRPTGCGRTNIICLKNSKRMPSPFVLTLPHSQVWQTKNILPIQHKRGIRLVYAASLKRGWSFTAWYEKIVRIKRSYGLKIQKYIHQRTYVPFIFAEEWVVLYESNKIKRFVEVNGGNF